MKDKISIFILRAGLGIVFLLFGVGKFNSDIWAQTIQGMSFFQALPWSTNISVPIIGALEILTGLCLITGFLTRFFAFLAALQLIAILALLNFQEIRDIGLLAIAVYLLLQPKPKTKDTKQ